MKHLVMLCLVVVVGSAFAGGLLGHPFTAASSLDAVGWERVEEAPERLKHAAGSATLELRQELLYRVTGEVSADLAGARALATLVRVLHGGDQALQDALEHHMLSQATVPPFTRIDNRLLTLRGAETGVAFEFAFIEFAASDFRASRHALEPEASVSARAFVDLACDACEAAWALLAALVQREGALGVRLELHHAPGEDRNAVLAAEALECVAAAQPFAAWPYALALHEQRGRWARDAAPHDALLAIALELGVAAPGLEACVRERAASREDAAAAQSARNLGLQAVPALFVGGVLMRDPGDAEEFARLQQLMTPPRVVVLAPAEDADEPAPVIDDPVDEVEASEP